MRSILILLSFLSCFHVFAQEDSIYYNNALKLIEGNEIDEAILLIDKAIDIAPHESKYFSEKAFLLSSLDKDREAIQFMDWGIKKNPKNPNFLIIRSGLFYITNEFEKSIKDLTKAYRLCSKDSALLSELLLSRSGAKLAIRDFYGSIEDLNLALEFDSLNVELLVNLGVSYGQLGELNKALEIFTKAYHIEPQNSVVLSNLGFLFLGTKQYKKAIGIINKAIILDSSKGERYNNRGFAYLKLGQLAKAEKDILKSIELYPENSFAYKNLALLQLEKKEIKKACNTLHQAKKMGFSRMYGSEVDDLLKEYCK